MRPYSLILFIIIYLAEAEFSFYELNIPSRISTNFTLQVRCVKDYGKLELDSGEVFFLSKNSQHYMPRVQVENLVRQGVLEHINWS